MQNRRMPVLAMLAAMLALSACASGPRMSAEEKLAAYVAAAGEPVKSFNYFGRISGWTPIDDRNIAVWTRAQEAWLLTFNGSCRDAEWAPAISLTHQGNSVYAGFDDVRVHGAGPGSASFPCRIAEIRPIDTKKVRAAEKAAREGTQDAPSGT